MECLRGREGEVDRGVRLEVVDKFEGGKDWRG